MRTVFGIDLGTTNSVVSYFDNVIQLPVVVTSIEGKSIFPSIIAIENGKKIFGDDAKAEMGIHENVAVFYKRTMGEDVPYFLERQSYTAKQLSTLFLAYLKKEVQLVLGETMRDVVIAVPAYFNNIHRQATKEAAKQAGLNVLQIINEPTAAALEFGMKFTKQQTIGVFDLGGGTFDFTLLKSNNGSIEVLTSKGDAVLGGRDFDERIVKYITRQFQQQTGINLLAEKHYTKTYFEELMLKAEEIKKKLSKKTQVSDTIIFSGEKVSFTITRLEFEKMTQDLIQRCIVLCENAIRQTGLSWHAISNMLLVGGSTRMPMIEKVIAAKTGIRPLHSVHPDQCVAKGAALQAAIEVFGKEDNHRKKLTLCNGLEVSKQDVTNFSLGIVALDEAGKGYINQIMIQKNTVIPAREKQEVILATQKNRKNEYDVYLLQGESKIPQENVIIGKYTFHNIPHTTGETKLAVHYNYNSSGIEEVDCFLVSTNIKLKKTRFDHNPNDFSFLKQLKSQQGSMPIYIMLCLDLSGSMSGDPLENAKKHALKELISLVKSRKDIFIGLMGVADRNHVFQEFTNNFSVLKRKLQAIPCHPKDTGTGNSSQPFDFVKPIFEDISPNYMKYLVVLADGIWSRQTNAIESSKTLNKKGVETFGVGFGLADAEFIKKIASIDGITVKEASNLGSAFGRIAKIIQSKKGGLRR